MSEGAIHFRDRESGEIVSEKLYSEKSLRFLYENRIGRALTDVVLSRKMPSKVVGSVKRSKRSQKDIPDFVARLGIDPSEAEKPVEEYTSLDDFFTRRLKPEVRPVDPDPDHLVFPADGRILVYPRLKDGVMSVKGLRVTLAQLLEDEYLERQYQGGGAVVIRLAPADYHRFHFPEAGEASEAREVGRKLHSVHPVALEAGAPAFQNKRMITRLRTKIFGQVLLIEVGALIVGTIEQTYRPGDVQRGQEKGMFRFGGSTVLLLSEAGRVTFDRDLVEASAKGMETRVKFGTRLGCKP